MVDDLIAKKYGLPNATAAKQWREANDLTPHHVEDGITIQLVPSKLHGRIPHLGGAAFLKKITE
jgi:filamentous hemagglutinin